MYSRSRRSELPLLRALISAIVSDLKGVSANLPSDLATASQSLHCVSHGALYTGL